MLSLTQPPRPGLIFTPLERRALRRIGFRSRSRGVLLRRSDMGRTLYSRRPPRNWSGPSRARRGKSRTADVMYPALEGLQLETFDARVCALELERHQVDVLMAVLRDRMEDRWEEVFQGDGGTELPSPYWGRYHKLMHLD